MRRSSAEELVPLLSDITLPTPDSESQAPLDVPNEQFFKRVQEKLREHMHELGFVVAESVVPAHACEALKEAMKTRARNVLQLIGHELGEDCSGLLRIGKDADRSPPTWKDSGKELPWGPFGRKGFNKTVGSGRLFQGTFEDEPAVVAVQEYTREVVAFFHNVDPKILIRLPERCSIKPPGSPVLRPHLDTERRGTFQVTPAGNLYMCRQSYS